jgi:UDP:flavonoid glycosyltransferase YjiC (YdhE family)
MSDKPLIYLVTVGSYGDIAPFIAIGRALQARGFHPRLYTVPYFEAEVRAAGIDCHPMGDWIDLGDIVRRYGIMDRKRVSETVVKLLLEYAPQIHSLMEQEVRRERPAALVSHHVCWGMRWFAEREDLPHANVVLAPMMWLSSRDPVAPLRNSVGVIGWLQGQIGMLGMRTIISYLADRHLNKLRRKLGYARDRGLFWKDNRGGGVNLGMWANAFRGPMPDDPTQGVICGFPWFDQRPNIGDPEGIEQFLAAGDAPVLFSLGTSAVHVAGDFYRQATRACRIAGCRGILLTGRADNIPSPLPPDILAVDYAPLSELAPRCAASVVHGGIGTLSNAIRAQKPVVVFPFAHDQFNNGVRLVRHGAGLMHESSRLTAESLAPLLTRCLKDPSLREGAKKLGASVGAENGAERAAGEIERLIERCR